VIQPIIVQTAGTFTDTVALGPLYSNAAILDACIDDVFGYNRITQRALVGKRMPPDVGHAAPAYIFAAETTIDLPAHVRELLNKETETERLQTLYLGLTGQGVNGDTLNVYCVIDILYTEQKKSIVIR
jgi:hypothetical protein